LLVVLPEGNTALSTGVLSGLQMNWSFEKINQRLIATALKKLVEEYLETFHTLAERQWDAITSEIN
jgi:hypothetical protein